MQEERRNRTVTKTKNPKTGKTEKKVITRNNRLTGKSIEVTREKDDIGRKVKTKISTDPFTVKVKEKSRTKGVKGVSISKYREKPTKTKSLVKSKTPSRSNFNNQPYRD